MAIGSSLRGEDPAAQIVMLALIDAPLEMVVAFVTEPGQLFESWLSLPTVKKLRPRLNRRYAQDP